MNDNILLSIKQFCREYSVSRSLVYRLMGGGDLKAVKVGRLTRIRRKDADDWARSLGSFKRQVASR